jgi:hypothetical protein
MRMTSPVSGNELMLITIELRVLASRDIHRTTIAIRRNLVLRHAGNIFHLTQVGWSVFLPCRYRPSLSTNSKTTSLTLAVF